MGSLEVRALAGVVVVDHVCVSAGGRQGHGGAHEGAGATGAAEEGKEEPVSLSLCLLLFLSLSLSVSLSFSLYLYLFLSLSLSLFLSLPLSPSVSLSLSAWIEDLGCAAHSNH